MNTLFKPTLAALSLALASLSLCALPAAAAPAKKPAKTVKPVEEKVVDEPEPDVLTSSVVELSCELNNKVTIYVNPTDVDNIAIRWKKRLHRLTRVPTTTGAQRFENKFYGLIWIGIPAKSMLLDSKQNRQLANECRTDEQVKAEQTTPSSGKL
jgi:cytochrome c5